MKKIFVLAAAALVALTACTKIETVEKPVQKITFLTANYMSQTKAGEVSVLNDFNEFKCLAFLHAEGVDLNADYSVKTDSYQAFFGSGETISPYNSSNAKLTGLTSSATNVAYWAPSHDYYWPKGEHSFVNFAGWYGTTGSAASDPTIAYAYDNSISKWKATLTWAFSNSTVGATGANLLYSDMAWRYNENPDASYKLNGLASGYKGVPMLFHHALAQINVKAYAASADSPALTAGTGNVTDGLATWTITLEDVTINNIYNAGTLTLTNADPGTTKTQEWTGDWAGTGSVGTLTTSDFTVQKVTQATAENLVAATCVLPQTIGTSVTLTFNMRIRTDYTGGVYNTELIPVTIKFNDMGTSAWAQNTKYTYYIIINPSQKTVRFDPALQADWSEATAGSATI